ncbi:MAG: DUF1697 domain-containing protein [Bacteroidota bacterium]
MYYISLLRGINVSGQKKIKMLELKALYERLGFTNVQTYIQSGNVIFESTDKDNTNLAKQISKKILEEFGYEVTVLVLDKNTFKTKIEKHPFNEADLPFLYFTFLSNIPEMIPYDKIEKAKQDTEEIHIVDDMIYFACRSGYGKSKLSNNFFEQKLKVQATTRNWKTSKKLLEMIQEAES